MSIGFNLVEQKISLKKVKLCVFVVIACLVAVKINNRSKVVSIQTYTKPFVNGNTGQESNLLYGDYICKLAVRRQGNGKVTVKEVAYGICGSASGSATDMDEAAYLMAEKIAKLSDGVLMGYFKKCGKYRNDEEPVFVHDLKTQYATLSMSNDPRAENPLASGPYPLKQVKFRVFIPWKRVDVSEQDIVATLKSPITVNGVDYQFGYSRFVDSSKSAIEVFPLNYASGVMTKNEQRVIGFDLVNNDTVAGSSDHVLSESYATIVDGDDDQGG